MSLTALEYDTLNAAFATCRLVLNDLQPRLAQLQQIYDSAGGVGDTITQEEMNEIPALSGLTVQQVTDGVYVLTALLLPAITQGTPALAQLSARYRGGAMSMPMVPSPMFP